MVVAPVAAASARIWVACWFWRARARVWKPRLVAEASPGSGVAFVEPFCIKSDVRGPFGVVVGEGGIAVLNKKLKE